MARNQARSITKDECLQILDMAEEKGLVLQPYSLCNKMPYQSSSS